jgi:membrane-bound metal-dependent hydrolase YbcI (DUF457 family)
VFVGHFAAGFAGKRFAPRVSLGTLILAGAFADLLWIIFFLMGVERVVIQPGFMAANSLNLVYVPFSHSLLMDIVWGAVFGGIYYLVRRDSRGAGILFAVVLSHWLLDFIVHSPDMAIAPGIDARFGLGLWNSQSTPSFLPSSNCGPTG